MKPALELTGLRFGRWRVLYRNGTVKGRGNTLWRCRCDCGTERDVVGVTLNSGASTSCGCLAVENMRKSKIKHGLAGSRLHSIWKNMRRRCLVPTNPSYANYGGRGITICDEWSDFGAFHQWAMSSGYRDDLTIERVNVDKGYSPSNCTWITRGEQNHNQRRTARRKDGTPWHLIAKSNGIRQIVFKSRISYGWSYEEAATLPLGSKSSHRATLPKKPSEQSSA